MNNKYLIIVTKGDAVDQIIPVTPEEGFTVHVLQADAMPAASILDEITKDTDYVVVLKDNEVQQIISEKHDTRDLLVEVYDHKNLPAAFSGQEEMQRESGERIGYYVNEFWNYEPDAMGKTYPYTVTIGIAYEADKEYDGTNFAGSHDGYGFDIYKTLEEATEEAKTMSNKIHLAQSLSEEEMQKVEAMVGKDNTVRLSMTESED